MSKSIGWRLSGLLVALVGSMLLSGCGGEEKIPLKKVDFVIDVPKDFKETRKEFLPSPNSSARMKGDPSGMNPN
jgi:hypothetical protein